MSNPNVDTYTYNETICKRRATWLKFNWRKVTYRPVKTHTYNLPKVLNTILDSIINAIDGVQTILCCRPKTMTFGRYYTNKGIQSLPREFRQTLISTTHWDLDMKNAQPTMLLNYCKKHDIPHKELENYCAKRPFIIKAMSEKYNQKAEDIKQSFISVVFGGHAPHTLIESGTILAFYAEMQIITDRVIELNPKMHKYATHKKGEKGLNIRGTTMSYLLQHIESDVLKSAIDFLTRNGFFPETNMFDGIAVLKSEDEMNSAFSDTKLASMLQMMKEYINGETGHIIEFVNKPQEEGYDINEEELKAIVLQEYGILFKTDEDCAILVVEKLCEKMEIVRATGNRYFIKRSEGIYSEDMSRNNTDVEEICWKKIAEMNFVKRTILKNGDVKLVPYSKLASGASSIFKFVVKYLPINNDFIERLWSSNLGKLCFKDGYWDFKGNKFVNWEDDKEGVLTTIFINRDFCGVDVTDNNDDNDADEKWILDSILNPMFDAEPIKKHYLNWISQAIAGLVNVKTWGVCIGNRNCGKGVLTTLLISAFGDYVREFNAEELICVRVGNGDPAKKLGWITNCEFTRLNIGNELKSVDDAGNKIKIDGNLIKSLSSGGDAILARKNYKDEVKIKMQGKIMMNMNDMLIVEPANAMSTLTAFQHNCEFKQFLTEDEIKINTMAESQFKYIIANPNIKDVIKNNVKYQDAMVRLIIKHYTSETLVEPVQLKDMKDDVVEIKNKTEVKLNKYFDFFIGDKSKFETVADVNTLMEAECGDCVSKAVYTRFFKSSGVINKNKTIDGKSVKCYFGLKFKREKSPTTAVEEEDVEHLTEDDD